MIVCRVCKIAKAYDEYGRRPNKTHGRHTICKSCKAEYDKARPIRSGQSKPEARRAQRRRYELAHPERYAAQNAVMYALRHGKLHREP